MPSDLKKDFDKRHAEGFIKTSDKPVGSLTSEQKVQLNRKGNILFNQGDIKTAERLFAATGNSDGLIRVGDIHQKEGNLPAALKMYMLAHNGGKTEHVSKKIAEAVSFYLKQED